MLTNEEGTTMAFLNLITAFKSDESGAVTVDWVVLTAAVVGLGIAVMLAIGPAISGLATNIAGSITAAQNTTTP
jgi:Flp pilus assembly pilin Flp